MMTANETSTSLPSAIRSASRARDFTRKAMADWGYGIHVEDAELLVSELVTNAVLHARSDIRMTLRHNGDALRIEVADASPSPPTPRGALADGMGGRGLRLIESLAQSWGVDPLPGEQPGKVVWCEMRI